MIITKHECTSCNVCNERCPVTAISMIENSSGFKQPIIDEDACIHCNLCVDVCPLNEKGYRLETYTEPNCYASWCKNKTIRSQSSTGGIFSILAMQTLKKKGEVCGASFDKNWNVKHIIVDNEEDLRKLRGSKYVQSDITHIFPTIKRRLEENIPILFCGTPCQVAGLYSYLEKDYPHLISVDFLCHGTPSPLVWRKYLEERFAGEKIQSINFRNKDAGWRSYRLSIQTDKQYYLGTQDQDIYMQAFLEILTTAPCCAECVFAKRQRPADLTLADFWEIDQYDKALDDNKGTSFVLINTEKARKAYESCREELDVSQLIPFNKVVDKNHSIDHPFEKHKHSDRFFQRLPQAENISDLIIDELGIMKVGITNFQHYNNYGCVMVPYSLSKAIEKLDAGFKPYIINFIPEKEYLAIGDKVSVFEKFKRDFIKRTEVVKNIKDLKTIDKDFQCLITGSDQVWKFHQNYIYMFSWACNKKLLISYAASFGCDSLKQININKKIATYLLSRFDAISVREKSGAKICSDYLNCEAEVVLDPTLLLEAHDYDEIIQEEDINKDQSPYIAYMFIFSEEKSIKLIDPSLSKSLPLINIIKNEHGEYRPVGQWLSLLKNASYLVTDSFHGCSFAINYRKQFICIPDARIDNILKLLNINRRCFLTENEPISMSSFEPAIDFDQVHVELRRLRVHSYDFLKKSLAIIPRRKEPRSRKILFKLMILELYADIKTLAKKVVVSRNRADIEIASNRIINKIKNRFYY